MSDTEETTVEFDPADLNISMNQETANVYFLSLAIDSARSTSSIGKDKTHEKQLNLLIESLETVADYLQKASALGLAIRQKEAEVLGVDIDTVELKKKEPTSNVALLGRKE